MQFQYQGYDLDGNFKSFEILDGLYDLENFNDRSNSKQFVWTAQTFSFSAQNLTKINFRIYSHIDNTLMLDDLKFKILPNVVLNISLENIKNLSHFHGTFSSPYTPITHDLRELGAMLYCITVDGTDLY